MAQDKSNDFAAQKAKNKKFLADKENNFYWYVLFVSNGHEFDVSDNIDRILNALGRHDSLKEIFIPIETVQVLKNKTFVLKNECLYSGYIFVLMKLDRLLIDHISELRYVFRFLLSDSRHNWPYILSDDEICKLNNNVKHKCEKESTKSLMQKYDVGDRVTIATGLFINMNAEVLKIKNGVATLAVFPFETSKRSIKTDVRLEDLVQEHKSE